MRLSQRYALPLTAVVWTALLPILHGTWRTAVDPCANPVALLRADDIAGATSLEQMSLEQGDAWLLQRTRGARTNGASGDLAIEFRVVRALKPPWLYWQPLGFAPRSPDVMGFPAQRMDVETMDETLPLRVVNPLSDRREDWIIAYFFVRGGRPIALPVQEQLVAPLRGEPRTPLTLYLASAVARQGERERAEHAVLEWLTAAWRHHRAVCTP